MHFDVVDHVAGLRLLHDEDDAIVGFVDSDEGRKMVFSEFFHIDDLVFDDELSVLDLFDFLFFEDFEGDFFVREDVVGVVDLAKGA